MALDSAEMRWSHHKERLDLICMDPWGTLGYQEVPSGFLFAEGFQGFLKKWGEVDGELCPGIARSKKERQTWVITLALFH